MLILPSAFLTLSQIVHTRRGLAEHVQLIHPAGIHIEWYAPIYANDEDTRRNAEYYEDAVMHGGLFHRFPELLDSSIPVTTWIKFRDLTENAWQRHRKRGDWSEEALEELTNQCRDILDALLTPCDELHDER
jgi:hypothetical protein